MMKRIVVVLVLILSAFMLGLTSEHYTEWNKYLFSYAKRYNIERSDKLYYCPEYDSTREIGFRDDGVVVWRYVSHTDTEVQR